ncbi:hypothetical protein PG996_002997 [Apiospora saccharicola]|uniref:Uncharacterized protein n=1 Tax=Apiospora saccharicola TaxID=335842 RepID=A0ABR1W041_9PEZI
MLRNILEKLKRTLRQGITQTQRGTSKQRIKIFREIGMDNFKQGKRLADDPFVSERPKRRRKKTGAAAAPVAEHEAGTSISDEVLEELFEFVSEGTEHLCMRMTSQWRKYLKDIDVLKNALSLEVCDIMKLMSIPQHTTFVANHLTQLAVLERAIYCSFGLRKMVPMPLLTKFSPRIRYNFLDPTPASDLEDKMGKADEVLQTRSTNPSDIIGELTEEEEEGTTRAPMIDVLDRVKG